MSRKKTHIDPIVTGRLRQNVSSTFGKQISRSFECEVLSTQVKAATGEYLSPQSLRRFFGFLDSGFNPAINSLNILSRYCGYFDWDDFVSRSQRQTYVPLTTKEEMALYLDFYKLQLQDEQDINFHNACRIINTRILNSPALLRGLAKPLAQNPVAQVYFYERFPFIDGLCCGYERSIKLYLQHKKSEEAQVFGICLLLLGAFLSKDNKLLHIIFAKLRRYSLQDKWHPFIIGRFIGSHLLFYHAMGQEEAKLGWLEQAKHYSNHFASASHIRYWKFPYYQFMVCDYLNLVREYRLSYKLLFPFRSIKHGELTVEEGYYDALLIIAYVSSSRITKAEQAGKAFQEAGLQKLGVIFKNYFTIQYLLVCLQSTSLGHIKKRKELLRRVDLFIRQTGFIYFRDFIK
jgi:hypothetical protein